MSCSSASHWVPRCSNSAASPLSSFRPQVSAGSKSLSRKSLPLLMRYGCTYFSIRSRISCLAMAQPPCAEGQSSASHAADDIHQRHARSAERHASLLRAPRRALPSLPSSRQRTTDLGRSAAIKLARLVLLLSICAALIVPVVGAQAQTVKTLSHGQA